MSARRIERLDSLVNAYAGTNNAQDIEMALKRRNRMLDEYQCDGILCNVAHSCKPWIGLMFEIKRQLAAERGIPYSMFNGDQADPRVFSKAQSRHASRV